MFKCQQESHEKFQARVYEEGAQTGVKSSKMLGKMCFFFFLNQAQYSEPYTITIVSDLFDVMQKV